MLRQKGKLNKSFETSSLTMKNSLSRRWQIAHNDSLCEAIVSNLPTIKRAQKDQIIITRFAKIGSNYWTIIRIT
jgi:hypothetical protein